MTKNTCEGKETEKESQISETLLSVSYHDKILVFTMNVFLQLKE